MSNQTQQKFSASLKKNDQVEVIAGREKGKTGKILNINLKTGRVTVEKINMVKRHTKPTQGSPQGGILEKELPLHYSNVLLFCAKCNRGVRHAHKVVLAESQKKSTKAPKGAAVKSDKAKKIRVCKKCNETLEYAGK